MSKIKLENIDTRPPKKISKGQALRELNKLKVKIEALQNLLFAENKHSLLIIFQGMDASGKDGAIRHVFDTVNPMGCRAIAFKEPTPLEFKHDFLWRIHQHVPEKGMIHIFNRSHYEDVLVQRVHKMVDEETVAKRYGHINHFELLLRDSGTYILKFYLHVSQKEQMKRLKERLKDKTKMWKYNRNDLKERRHWNDYRIAYEDVFKNCSAHAEWHIIPSDKNWYKELLIAIRVVDVLENFKMKYPGLKQ